MARSILRVFAWLGILLFFFGLFVRSFAGAGYGGSYILFGLLIVVATVLLAISPDVLRNDQVSDSWSTLIEKANGKAKDVLNGTEAFLAESRAPALGIAKRKVSTSLVGGIVGNEREFLVITDKQSLRLRSFQVFVSARDYGENLDVSWYVTYRPTIVQALLSVIVKSYMPERGVLDLNIFDQQDVRAYARNTHRCLRKAVEKVITELGQDPSQIDWKSQGFLGIS